MHPQLKFFLYLLLGAATVLITLLAVGVFKARSECLHSAQAVWNAHPGAHATWSMRHGKECWYARGLQHKAAATGHAQRVPLPRPAMRTGGGLSPVGPPSTPRGLVAVEHDQFRTWSADSALDTDVSALVFLLDRMISAGWRLWLQASVEKSQDAQARLLPLR